MASCLALGQGNQALADFLLAGAELSEQNDPKNPEDVHESMSRNVDIVAPPGSFDRQPEDGSALKTPPSEVFKQLCIVKDLLSAGGWGGLADKACESSALFPDWAASVGLLAHYLLSFYSYRHHSD